MNWLEKVATRVRHLPGLRSLSVVWNALRPLYDRVVTISSRGRGVSRRINGMDEVRLLPQYRGQLEVYEPEVWQYLLPQVRPGDRIADVGAHHGLYAVAFGKRTGPSGRVWAVEGDGACAEVLAAHLRLNHVDSVVRIVRQALSDRVGEAAWHSQSQQSVLKPGQEDGERVSMTTLDTLIPDGKVDLMLLDIEGHEEPALRGGSTLLSDPSRRPRLIVIEVHPYNWHLSGGSSESLTSFLRGCGYALRHLDGSDVAEITRYGHIVAEAQPS